MSSFLKKGKRQAVRKKNKEIKHRTKEFYRILRDLDETAKDIANKYKGDTDFVNEDNIVEVAAEFTDRKIEHLEKLVLLGKLEGLGFTKLRVNKEEEE